MSRIAMLNGLGKAPRRKRRKSRRARHYSYPMHGSIGYLGADGDTGGGGNTMLIVLGLVAVGAFFLLRKKDDETESDSSGGGGGGYQAPYSAAQARVERAAMGPQSYTRSLYE